MFKKIKQVVLGSLGILLASTICFSILLLNPELSYANKTSFGNIDVHHNTVLSDNTEQFIEDVVDILKTSSLYRPNQKLDLCLNDGSIYPELHPFAGAFAYAFMNKAVFYHCKPDFENNTATAQWEINNHEIRRYNLTELIAHEFVHCLQNKENFWVQFKAGFWKMEGHAEYIGRQWKGDQKLKEKIELFIEEEQKDKTGIPIIILEDGTLQNLLYYKYGIVCQYLMDIKGMTYQEYMADDRSLDELYQETLSWSKKI